MDTIVETAAEVRKLGWADRAPLNIISSMAERLQGTPRFLLDAAATRTMVELTLGRPKVLREAMAYVRVPYPRLWVEWPESAREKLRRSFRTDNFVRPDRPIPQRVGFLLEGDESSDWKGRSGRVTWAWTSGVTTFPNIGPIEAHFDLDRTFNFRLEGDISAMTNHIAAMWKDNDVQYRAFQSIWHTVEHVPSEPYGRDFMRTASKWEITNAVADVFGEYITIWATMMLLTSSRKILNLTPVDNTRLNRARTKRREAPRLDHSVATLWLDPAARERQTGAPLGYTRKSPRVHLVSSYLARRGAQHWIVAPYWRGQGETIYRHVQVKG